ncbi:hypothetical protein ABFS82_11G056100 [Erythranthe guttata]|uniref:nudix hydrolase 8-like isoform X1 n=1 Tax=Erythranthe guttata TaxID=4155 RepID=UPI00064DB66E|nr:PREDICTED: nudix hydrolase 8-like isoform X1 [Erythranthe guttata]|eukprot:XP_012845429.1 PREDICTED: nudix hydrolase 8-like isoform X1 [Erythranthe guttata]
MASKLLFCQLPVPLVHISPWQTPRIKWTKNSNISSNHSFVETPDSIKAALNRGRRFDHVNCVQNNGVVQVMFTPPSVCVESLNGSEDEYNGIVIDPTSLPSSANAFASLLKTSLSTWKSKGKKGIWLKIFEEQAHLVPIAIQEGFVYHHAEDGYVMLTHWIPDEPCSLPCGPRHQIGVAGFVINHNKEILVVKEKCSYSCCGVWKLPTGYIDKSEELFSGAVREVKEETGIDTTFLELVAFRHIHKVAFEKSDLLFVCMLKPLSLEIKIDQNEIQDAKWMSLDELVSQEFYEEDEMSKRVIEICRATYEKNYSGFVAHQVVSKFDGKLSSYLYYKDVDNVS